MLRRRVKNRKETTGPTKTLRPAVWRRASEDGYDQTKAGLEIEALSEIPAAVTDPREQREYFDTRRFGKSAAGHLFPDALTEPTIPSSFSRSAYLWDTKNPIVRRAAA